MMTENLTIHYHDDAIVVTDKPGGLLAVPGRGPARQDCLVSRLRRRFPEMIAQPAVHRLDMFTSGLMVLALTREAHRMLSKQFEERTVVKRYLAMLEGTVPGERGEIQLPFRLDPDNRPFQIYDPIHGKMGHTLWETLSVENGRTRVLFTPITGRTHQLRLHAAHHLGLGCPIVGDSLYGRGREGDRMLLHASVLEFDHPETGVRMRFASPAGF